MATATEELQEGAAAPDFSVKDQDGKTVRLSDFKGRQIVLYFYPKDDTPGCTKESCGFRDNEKRLQAVGAQVLGVSLDGPESHRKFIKKFSLNFPLLSDEDAKVSKLYGVYKKKAMFANIFMGIERSTFVIGADGKLKKIFRKVKVDGHTEEVLAAL
ncbi:MAG: alkyl hydroperoxide reductase [Elusimicrobia bacterium RIFCSPLOWO2_01_FULL_60_11]|nr:MAG: alkyl hydroperoxide reductase [Elusimicrobia bacterium RIFCSPLOWO2_01_FULL_60_11]